jgi:serine/threonine-protein kinase
VSIVPRLTTVTQYEPSPNSAPISSARTPTDSGEQPFSIRGYSIGDRIGGKYTLIERLGEGGMGTVWRAHNELLDVDVALKVLRTDDIDASDGTLMSDRLLQEARAAARLGHPSIARVFDYGTTERNNPYIVMELLKGEDLAEALSRRGRVNSTKAVSTMMPIAHALAAAHVQGIVHRDLKPENVFLSRLEDGRVVPKLVDFGIAKIDRGRTGHRLTQTGTMLGSPIYMSPEQARGDDVDHRADIWAFCVVLYELVAGRTPFEGRNYNALLYAIISEEPRPMPFKADGDDELWAILRRGFEKEPDNRWQSSEEMGRALAQWLIIRGVQEDITGASLVAQWFRAMPAGDALTSMLPQPMQHFDMPAIPRRSDRAKWATQTRSLGPRAPMSSHANVAAWYARLGGAVRETSSVLKSRLRDTTGFQVMSRLMDIPLVRANGWSVGAGAGASVVLGALAVAFFAQGEPPELSVTEVPLVEAVIEVRLLPDATQSDLLIDLLSHQEPSALPATAMEPVKSSPARVNRYVARRPAASSRPAGGNPRLKNPFD